MTMTNNAVAGVEEALSLTGNHGLSRTNPLERHCAMYCAGGYIRRRTTPSSSTPGALRSAFNDELKERRTTMSVEFIGFIGNNPSSETTPRTGPVLDVTHIETFAKAHENAGFDRALLAFHSTCRTACRSASTSPTVTERLKSSSRSGRVSPRRRCSRGSSPRWII